jgi:hypothetical protein
MAGWVLCTATFVVWSMIWCAYRGTQKFSAVGYGTLCRCKLLPMFQRACDILVALWNWLHVVLTPKCAFYPDIVLIRSGSVPDLVSPVSLGGKMWEESTQLVEKQCGTKYCVFNKHTAFPIIQFSQHEFYIHSSHVLHILWYRIWGAHGGEDS